MKIKRMNDLVPLIDVDEDKCVNCQACISVCPVKYCNDGSTDVIHINHNLCIGCGKCIQRCTHDARKYRDDIEEFEALLLKHEKIVVVAAPSIVSSFPEQYLRLNGWFRSMNIDVFDVSFGAELTTKSYVEYIQNENPSCVIAQPCPAIVTYIELYVPELIPYLAPVDSPIGHTIKMIHDLYRKYSDYRVVALTPCLAKRRELNETFEDAINVSFKSLQTYLEQQDINLNEYDEVPFCGPNAERGVFFPVPGGLLETAERYIPDIREKARQIEGHENVYHYLDQLPKDIKSGKAPLLVDCLSCEHGCNVGCLSLTDDRSLNELEEKVRQRRSKNKIDVFDIENFVNKIWKADMFSREYEDKSENNRLFYPSKKEIREIYAQMGKFCKADLKDCDSCGYGTCEAMAVAIYNRLNKPENCHLYLAQLQEKSDEEALAADNKLIDVLANAPHAICILDEEHKISMVNDKFCTLLNVRREKMLQSSVFSKWVTKLNEMIRVRISDTIIVNIYIVQNGENYVCFFIE